MIELMRPNTADLHQSIFLDDETAKKEMDQTILDERSKFGKTVSVCTFLSYENLTLPG